MDSCEVLDNQHQKHLFYLFMNNPTKGPNVAQDVSLSCMPIENTLNIVYKAMQLLCVLKLCAYVYYTLIRDTF